MIPLCNRSDIAPIRSTSDDTITCTTAVQLRKARIDMTAFISVLFFVFWRRFVRTVAHGNGESVVWRSKGCL